MSTLTRVSRDAIVLRTPAQKRRVRLLRLYSHHIPNFVFEELFGITEGLIRVYRRMANPSKPSMRLDTFARTTTLPPLKLLTEDERVIVTRCWEELRVSYARTPQTRRLRRVARLCTTEVPTEVIAELFGVTGGAVTAHQRDLGISLTSTDANALRRRFLDGVAAPRISGLSPAEQSRIDAIWKRMRAETGTDKRAREDELLRTLNLRLPSAVFVALFQVTTAAISMRRKELGLRGANCREVLRRFLALQAAPTISGLTAAEQAVVTRVWNEERERADAERRLRFSERTKALVRRLNAAARELGGQETVTVVRCGNKGCKRRFPRTAAFFYQDRTSHDGLSPGCKVCEYQRRTAARLRGRVRETGRLLSRAERSRIIEVLGTTTIPSRFLLLLFRINREHLARLRAAAGVPSTAAEGWRCYLRWVSSDTMPEVPALRDGEAQALRAIWSEAKRKYEQSIVEDDGRLGLQQEELRRVLALGGTPELIRCWGPYCKGERSWPKGKECFRKLTRQGENAARCHACANLEARQQAAAELRSG